MTAMANRPFAVSAINVDSQKSTRVVPTAVSRTDIRASSRRRVGFTSGAATFRRWNNNNNIIIITEMIFMVLSSWHSHCESSRGSFDECRLSASWPPTLRPSQSTWTASPSERNGSYRPHPPSPFIITHYSARELIPFYRPKKGGRLSQPRHCSKGVQPMPKAVYRSGCRDKHNCPRWYSNLGPLTPQSGMLPLDHCDTECLNVLSLRDSSSANTVAPLVSCHSLRNYI